MFQLRKEILLKNNFLSNEKQKKNKTSKKQLLISNIEVDKLYEKMFNRTKIDSKSKECLYSLLKKIIRNLLYMKIDALFKQVCKINFPRYQQIKEIIKKAKGNKQAEIDFPNLFTELNAMNLNEKNVCKFLQLFVEKFFTKQLFGKNNL